MKKLLTLGLAVLCFASNPVAAYDDAEDFGCPCVTTTGMYLGLYAGGHWWLDSFAADSTGVVREHEMDSGYVVGGYFGYRCCSGLRFEVDLGYRDAGIDRLVLHDSAGSGISEPTLTGNSELTAFSYLGNIIFECVWEMCDCCMRPYFGFGAGGATVSHQAHYSGFDVDDDETVFAYQLIIGLAMPLCDDCIDLGIEYRHFRTADFTLSSTAGNLNFNEWLHSHSVVVSVKKVFGSCW